MIREPLRAGVVGVGSMGHHHARVYNEIQETELVGVVDADRERAAETAEEFGTAERSLDGLLSAADLVSVAVPTRAHYDVARRAIDRGVGVLVEKPFVDDLADGRELIDRADDADVPLAVGHIERFNPVVDVLEDVLTDVEVVAVDARRLGPPVERDIGDDVVLDLMIHDIDVALTLLDEDIAGLTAVSDDPGDYAAAQLEFEGGAVCSLTASRVTQERIRELSVTTPEFHVTADYIDQSVHIYRHTAPEYRQTNGDVRYTQSSVIERPTVDGGEPLKRELRSFARTVRDGGRPRIPGEAGVRAISVAREISDVASSRALARREVTVDGPAP